MRKPNIYLTKKVRRNLELKERKAEKGFKSYKGGFFSKLTKDEKAILKQEKRNEKLERKVQLRALKAKKRAERQERKQQHKSK
jgi:hypothetical protein